MDIPRYEAERRSRDAAGSNAGNREGIVSDQHQLGVSSFSPTWIAGIGGLGDDILFWKVGRPLVIILATADISGQVLGGSVTDHRIYHQSVKQAVDATIRRLSLSACRLLIK